MKHMDLIHTCTNPRCLEEQGIEAQTEERDGRVHVRCRLCGRRRDYPTDALNRTSTALVAEHLRESFVVVERYISVR